MNTEHWSDRENDAVVAVYFQMLVDDLAGRAYNKAMKNSGFSSPLVSVGLPLPLDGA